ncbi:MAG: DUF192 domain-containing protein [Wenzhouxiangella sp.]
MTKALLRYATLILALAFLAGCHAGEPWVEVEGKRFYVEIADDDESRARGLMFRDELADNRGMLFIFRQERPRSFWMKNTRIPLDIIYLDGDLRVVSISADTPPCRSRTGRCPGYRSAGPARYVLEINAGQAEALGLARGDRVNVGNIPQMR